MMEGGDSIDHSPGAHDDLANAVAGLAAIAKRGGYDTSLTVTLQPTVVQSALHVVSLQRFVCARHATSAGRLPNASSKRLRLWPSDCVAS
jgi:hypothetical protein